MLTIDKESFELLDELDNIPIVDSFVKCNKIGRGSGEARLYLGPQGRRNYEAFFVGFPAKCFFLRQDIETYLFDAKFEYEEQEQKYRRDISKDWQPHLNRARQLSNREHFIIRSAVGTQDAARYYIRSVDDIFRDYFRCIMLPTISYVSILKLKKSTGETVFLFRPALSYNFNPYYHPAKIRETEKAIKKEPISKTQKEQLVQARVGQGKYREELLKESAECIITRVNDERILVASHIKPWSVSTNKERLDFNNGLVLTPTYDKLFDQGFISFQDDGVIMISPYISPLNVRKLNLSSGKKYVLPPIAGRGSYLDYHRRQIFKP